ncbi:MAG: response regulator transcription factor [Rhodothermales bacterium]|nr:response regulator transcription factor [Rhodothermales bacterium]MCA0267601.1 response regulator transcription factor [Bacteroidota bacterium]
MNDDLSGARLLIVEDDPQLSTGLQLYLESFGYDVTVVNDGAEGLEEASALPGYDLVVLDAKLPGKSGFDILREMRARGAATPVLMLTGMGSAEDRIRGFELGADDYLTKPFVTEELLARIQVILKRARPDPVAASGMFLVGGLVVDLDNQSASRDGKPVDLTDLEFRLLRYFLVHRGRTVSRKQLLRDVWNLPSEVETRTIDRHVNALRKVMDGEDEDSWPIRSVYGIGYKLVGADAAA